MRTKSLNKIDLPNGSYKGRLGGKTVVIRLPEKTVRFDVAYDATELSLAVWVTVKNGKAVVVNNGYY